MRILLVEDDRDLGAALVSALELGGYRVDWVRRGDDFLTSTSAEDYELVLLDLGLPSMTGLDALTTLRGQRDMTPVIIITARDRPEQKVAGLDAGADDYMVKPLDLDELLARIRAQIRRRDGRGSDLLVVGRFGLDLSGRIAWKDELPVAITAKEYKILALLMRRAGRYVGKREIEAHVYQDEVEIGSNTIEVAISALRRKFGSDAILTARGLGYMMPK